ncbi:MAG: ferritin-like domain-containing protein [Actinomycetota bacterium]|nr:ferritin-like domain-containing protein [Actinomycetota bacterium]
MSDLFKLEELDTDGAIQETAEQVDVDTRAAFLRKAGIGLGAVAGSGALVGALPGVASAARVPRSDIAILNFALTLEFLEAAFYAEANRNRAISGELLRFSQVVGRHENAHVAFLRRALGRKAVKRPRFNFKGTTANAAKFAQTAQVLEDTGVKAYLGQVGNIKAKAILKAAGSILPVEARHAAWIRDIRGNGKAPSPAPSGFETGLTKNQVLAAVKGTGFIVGK